MKLLRLTGKPFWNENYKDIFGRHGHPISKQGHHIVGFCINRAIINVNKDNGGDIVGGLENLKEIEKKIILRN